MAILLSVTTPTGVTASYHNIQKIVFVKGGSLDVQTFSYFNQAARQSRLQPLLDSSFHFDGVTEYDEPSVYGLLKTLTFFSGATDV